MCVANLNVATPCSHRWYKLVRSCSPDSNLSNCSKKLRLEGWETRNDQCPFCSAETSPSTNIDEATHKLCGSMSRHGSYSSALSSLPRRPSRANSVSTNSTSLSRSSSRDSNNGTDLDRGEQARMMNKRLEAYLSIHPGRIFSNRGEEKDRMSDDELASSETASITLSRSGSVLGKGFKRGMRISRSMFKG